MTTLEGMTPGTWTLDPAHTEVAFSVRHAGISKVAEDASQSNGQVAVGMNSVDTKNETRDNHVRSAEFFDVENHPQMTYKITGLELNDGEGTVTGELTLRGVTKPVKLDAEFNGVAVDPFGATRAGGVMVSDKVRIDLDVEFTAPESTN